MMMNNQNRQQMFVAPPPLPDPVLTSPAVNVKRNSRIRRNIPRNLNIVSRKLEDSLPPNPTPLITPFRNNMRKRKFENILPVPKDDLNIQQLQEHYQQSPSKRVDTGGESNSEGFFNQYGRRIPLECPPFFSYEVPMNQTMLKYENIIWCNFSSTHFLPLTYLNINYPKCRTCPWTGRGLVRIAVMKTKEINILGSEYPDRHHRFEKSHTNQNCFCDACLVRIHLYYRKYLFSPLDIAEKKYHFEYQRRCQVSEQLQQLRGHYSTIQKELTKIIECHRKCPTSEQQKLVVDELRSLRDENVRLESENRRFLQQLDESKNEISSNKKRIEELEHENRDYVKQVKYWSHHSHLLKQKIENYDPFTDENLRKISKKIVDELITNIHEDYYTKRIWCSDQNCWKIYRNQRYVNINQLANFIPPIEWEKIEDLTCSKILDGCHSYADSLRRRTLDPKTQAQKVNGKLLITSILKNIIITGHHDRISHKLSLEVKRKDPNGKLLDTFSHCCVTQHSSNHLKYMVKQSSKRRDAKRRNENRRIKNLGTSDFAEGCVFDNNQPNEAPSRKSITKNLKNKKNRKIFINIGTWNLKKNGKKLTIRELDKIFEGEETKLEDLSFEDFLNEDYNESVFQKFIYSEFNIIDEKKQKMESQLLKLGGLGNVVMSLVKLLKQKRNKICERCGHVYLNNNKSVCNVGGCGGDILSFREAEIRVNDMNETLGDHLNPQKPKKMKDEIAFISKKQKKTEKKDISNDSYVRESNSPIKTIEGIIDDPGSYSGVNKVLKKNDNRQKKRKQETKIYLADGSPAYIIQKLEILNPEEFKKKFIRVGGFHTMAVMIRNILYYILKSCPLLFIVSGFASKAHMEFIANCKEHHQSRDFIINLYQSLFITLIQICSKSNPNGVSKEVFYKFIREKMNDDKLSYGIILFRMTGCFVMSFNCSRVNQGHQMNVGFELFDPFLQTKPAKYQQLRLVTTQKVRRIPEIQKQVLEENDLAHQRSGRKIIYQEKEIIGTQPVDALEEEDNKKQQAYVGKNGDPENFKRLSILHDDLCSLFDNNSAVFQNERKQKYDENCIRSVEPFYDVDIINIIAAIQTVDIDGDQLGLFNKKWDFVTKNSAGEEIKRPMSQLYPLLVERYKSFFERSKKNIMNKEAIVIYKKFCFPISVNGHLSDEDFFVDELDEKLDEEEEEEELEELEEEDLDEISMAQPSDNNNDIDNDNNNNNENNEFHKVINCDNDIPVNRYQRLVNSIQRDGSVPCTCGTRKIQNVGDTCVCVACRGYFVEHSCGKCSRDENGNNGFNICRKCVNDDYIICCVNDCGKVFRSVDDVDMCAECDGFCHLDCSQDCLVRNKIISQEDYTSGICADCNKRLGQNDNNGRKVIIIERKDKNVKRYAEKKKK